ncbi:MAG: hypothetical protein WHT08_05895 [Bryobacteraceae bacterium]
MKEAVPITRRRLARYLGLAAGAGAAAAAGAADQERAPRPGRLRRAAEKLGKTRPGRNISPAFRFIP